MYYSAKGEEGAFIVDYDLDPGVYAIYIKYRKDGSVSYDDEGFEFSLNIPSQKYVTGTHSGGSDD